MIAPPPVEPPVWTFWVWNDYRINRTYRPVRCDVTPEDIRFPECRIPLEAITKCTAEDPFTIYSEKSWVMLEFDRFIPYFGRHGRFSIADPYAPAYGYRVDSEHEAFVQVVNSLRDGMLPEEIATNPYVRNEGTAAAVPDAGTSPLVVAPGAERAYWVRIVVVLTIILLGFPLLVWVASLLDATGL